MNHDSVKAAITGKAFYRERIASPPDATFEAVLEDVSRADDKAEEIAKTKVVSPAGPPISFTIDYEADRIDQSRSYSVRARIVLGGELRFVSDRLYPVLTRGAGREVEILLRMVPKRAPGDR